MYDTYTVKPGDTLYGISNQFGVSVTELAELNNIQGSNLPVGTVLKIPSKSGVNPNNMFMYTVKSGDTLYSIARKYNTTVSDIINLNYLKSNDLSVGQVIRIPETYFKPEEMSMPNYISYTVKPGDTLYSIASANGVSVSTIISDNVLPNNSLSVGQILRLRVSDGEVLECFGPDFDIPIDVVPSITYEVKAGDNLYNIAKMYNTSVSAISNLNNLSNNNLSVGQQLLIPTALENANSSVPNKTYIVQRGDSLYSIARKFNTTVSDITRLNSLSGTSLSIGQKLLIPSSSSSSESNRTYVVQRGDSLYSIARKFNTTVDSIRSKNNLVSNLLSVGQTLIIYGDFMIYNINDKDFLNSELYKNFISENPGLGFLKIRAYAASQAVPISGLSITISKEIDGNKVIFFEGITNDSGVIEKIALPVPRMGSDNMIAPLISTYDINTTYEGENRLYKVNVYDNIYVVQNINVTPNISYGVTD